jgi:hypothetical protein
MGLDLAQPLRTDDLQPLKAVGDPAAMEVFEARQLFGGSRNDDLPQIS